MRIIICGGHLSPALAVIERLPKEDKVIVMGRKHAFEEDTALSLEYQTMTSRNIPFISLMTGRLQRHFSRHTIPSLLKTPYGLIQAYIGLRTLRPDVVLSFGGYVAVPVAIAAKLLRIPIVVHEQTLEAGASNIFVGKFARKICISWESSAPFFPASKTVLTGNPVRKYPISNTPASTVKRGEQLPIPNGEDPLLYITGGSSGSHAINELVEGALEKLIKKYRIIHQTGDAKLYGDFDRLIEKRESLGEEKDRYIVTKFVKPEEVAQILEKADLIISRSGMNTVTELLYFEKPSLLIPLPISQNNEQGKNAQMLKDAGLSEIMDQQSLTPDILSQKIQTMMENIDTYKTKVSIKNTLENAADGIIRVLHGVVAS